MNYKDFWLRIERRADGFWVESRSPAGGESSTPIKLPADVERLRLTSLLAASKRGEARGPAGEVNRDMIVESEAVKPELAGAELFRTLFSGPIRDAFNRNWGSGQEGGVRIRIQTDLADPELAKLASLPWELLYNEAMGTAMGRSKLTPIVRYLDVPLSYETLPAPSKLRVLIVLANPRGTHPLDLAKERASIEKTWGTMPGVDVTILEHATAEAMFEVLDTGSYHVPHYMGHGGFDPSSGAGVLLLEDSEGEAAPLAGTLLGETLHEMRSMRLVVLNACETGRTSHEPGFDPFSGVASALVMAGVPAVVAMQVPVSDQAAVEFAGKFYSQLLAGEPVDAAVAVGRRAIHRVNPNSPEWATPVLFMRAPDGRLFAAEGSSTDADMPRVAGADDAPPQGIPSPADRSGSGGSTPAMASRKPPSAAPASGGGMRKYLIGALGAVLALILLAVLWPSGGSDSGQGPAADLPPSELTDPADAGGAALPDASQDAFYGTIDLSPGFEPHPMNVYIERIGGQDEVTVSGPGCSGFINSSAPDVHVRYSGGGDLLLFETDSASETTLLVRLPDGSWVCNADPEPQVVLDFPEAGTFSVWVGAYSREDVDADATLYIAEAEALGDVD